MAVFDLNGLKDWNDRYGHSTGDELIRRTAGHIAAAAPGRGYRMGGDEFLILDTERDEAAFRSAVDQAWRAMEAEDISVAVGLSWREGNCDPRAQTDEADRLMYDMKERFYRSRWENSGKP